MANSDSNRSPQDILDAFHANLPLSKLNPLVKAWRGIADDGIGPNSARPLKVAVLANHSTQFLCGGLQLALAKRSIQAEVYEGGYNQVEMDLLDPNGTLHAFQPDVVLISLTTALLAMRGVDRAPAETAAELSNLVENAHKALGARIVLTLPEPLEEETHSSAWSITWRRTVNDVLRERLSKTCVLVDLEPLIRQVGARNWFAGRLYVAQKLSAHPDMTALIADYLAQHITAAVSRPVRLVAVDLDNTLWGGIVGEVGWQGVDLDAEGKGLGHLKLQRFLLDLYEKGVILIAVSKNNRRDALEVFDNRPEMILRVEHFADMKIDWSPKSDNIRQSLDDLNLTEIGAAFIDDNPAERAEVRAVFPDIHVPEFPADIIDLVPSLSASGRFLIARSTEEDKNRQEFYRTEGARLRARTVSNDLSSFYASLELKLRPHPVGVENMHRVLDLIAKTNQFNLTGSRHGASRVESILATKGAMAWAYQLTDKFGDYGLIGVVLGLPEEDRTLTIDTWVLSCRAMGRTVEHGIFRHLCDQVQGAGYDRIKGVFISTKRNQPVDGLYERLGCAPLPAESIGRRCYEFLLDTHDKPETHVELI